MSPTLFASMVAAAIVLAALALGSLSWWALAASRRRQVLRRLRPGEDVPTEFADADVNPLLVGIAGRGKAIEGLLDDKGETAQLLIRAGWRDSTQRLVFYVFQALSPLLLLLALALLWPFAPERVDRPLFLFLFGIMAVVLGLLMPRMLLRRKAEARQARLRSEVPLFIHTLVLLFESGLSTRQAFSSLVREGRGVLNELELELEVILRQLEAGAELSDVLTRLAAVLDVPDLTTVLLLLRQVDRYGGEVKEPLLDTLSVMEDRRELELREKVNLIAGRMTVIMVLFFFPALLIFVAGPAWVSLIAVLGDMGSK